MHSLLRMNAYTDRKIYMIVYSKKIIKFMEILKSVIKEVLSNEIRLRICGERFFNRQQTSSYPISIAIYNDRNQLGYFNPNFYELGFHACLMLSSKEQLYNIVRHELAHYIVFINFGSTIQPHGTEFIAFCQRMGWGKEVYQATFDLNAGITSCLREESAVFRKVKKLMALATSSNQNEAELAMIKSQQLLLKHNVEADDIDSDADDEKVFLERVLKQKKKNAKMCAIAAILDTFFVNRVYDYAEGFVHLAILGAAVNVEIAAYVAGVLDSELDRLWIVTKKQHVALKGMVAKNSFFYGLANGYCNKINALKREYSSEVKNALMLLENKLVDAISLVYPRLSRSRSHARYCAKSWAIGEVVGKELTINSALKEPSKKSGSYIGFDGL